uniref:Uncharacterized protein LOC111117629 isoform X2 n=1 Tax=Crassostrea virginica TaxID=6565 RepID=A0A8B8CBH1_CRAVI|nr:uncharacterized protein LOC111117629 isoform X2 [Crassostrea virginica]
MTLFLILMLTTEVVANKMISSNIMKGFCEDDQVHLTLPDVCDFTDIYVSIHNDIGNFSNLYLQCTSNNMTCHSFGSMTFRLTNETLEVFFQFQHREHVGKYVNFKTTCQNQTDVPHYGPLKACRFTGNVTKDGDTLTVLCQHSSFNESVTGMRIGDRENEFVQCSRNSCHGGHRLPNGVALKKPYEEVTEILCKFDGAVLNLTNLIDNSTLTTAPSSPVYLSHTGDEHRNRRTRHFFMIFTSFIAHQMLILT